MSFQSSMDIIHKRFPHLTQNVLKNLDIQSLIRSKEANREIAKCLNYKKFYWIRIIKTHKEKFEGFEESWGETLNKSPLEMIKQLAIAVQHFFKHHTSKEIRVAPLHIATDKGSSQLCQYAFSKATDKNPEGKLRIGLRRSSLGFAKFEIQNNKLGIVCEKTTPFQLAAMNGNLELCSLMIDNGYHVSIFVMGQY